MSSYSGSAGKPDRAKAIVAVAAVHLALAFAILSGLSVRENGRAVEQLTKTIEIKELPPPVEVRLTRPKPKPRIARKPEGAAMKQATAVPFVAPVPIVPVRPEPVPSIAAGTQASSGAAIAGSGAGGSGTGAGPRGYGDYSRFTPAQLVSNIPNSQYARLAATGISSGAVGVLILVETNGSVSNCRIARSSGEQAIDALVCQLTERYVRFSPARDPEGRPVPQDITYFPSWRRR